MISRFNAGAKALPSSAAGRMLEHPPCGKYIENVRRGAVDQVFGLVETIREVLRSMNSGRMNEADTTPPGM
jgi:hypothetical protein